MRQNSRCVFRNKGGDKYFSSREPTNGWIKYQVPIIAKKERFHSRNNQSAKNLLNRLRFSWLFWLSTLPVCSIISLTEIDRFRSRCSIFFQNKPRLGILSLLLMLHSRRKLFLCHIGITEMRRGLVFLTGNLEIGCFIYWKKYRFKERQVWFIFSEEFLF